MLKLEGVVLATLTHPERTGRDGKTYEGYSQVQLQVEELLENDQVRYGIHTLTTTRPGEFEQLAGKHVSIPVRAYVRNGGLAFSMPPQAKPELLRSVPSVGAG